jgi:hypothetical protein
MKKILLTSMFVLCMNVMAFAQCPNFIANDCNGNSHNLHNELDAGNVIVLVWVMPCGSCTGPALTAYNIVQSYGSNVKYYLIDDAANTSCTSLSNWATSSGIGTNRTTFSTSAIVESNYGGVGMPHVAVVATSNHTYYFNALNSAAGNSSGIQTAINNALAAVGVPENSNDLFNLSVVPFAASHSIKVSYSIPEQANVTMQVVNAVGQSVHNIDLGKQYPGNYSSDIDLANAAAGVYFMHFTAGVKSKTIKFFVSK